MHLVSPNRPSTGYQRDSGTDYVQVYTNSLGSTTITDGFGGSMIYEADDSTIVNTIEGAIPIIHTTGFHQPPIGYLLPPDGEYRTLVHKNKSTLSYLSAYSDTLILIAGHTNADSTQQDWFKYSGSSLTVINIDPFSKLSNFGGVIIEDSVNQKTFDLLDLNNAQNDSLQLEVYQHDKLKLVNFGVAKAYNIKLRLFTLLNISEFEHSLVPVGTNSTHFIEPNWDNLSTVVVLTDIGNNGTIDDTLYLNNTVDVKDEGSLISPKEYQLAQNYPNPFNPTTKISYSIPQRGIVTLKVYDILGNEVSTLVNEEQSAGNYEVDFNAARLSSGIYFYKLQTENFVETKKMILLK
jgi:hypothetical protein